MRTRPLGYEWPGAYFIGQEEIGFGQRGRAGERSPFRYYGLDCRHMCDKFGREVRAVRHRAQLPVSSGTAALNVAMAAWASSGQEVLVPATCGSPSPRWSGGAQIAVLCKSTNSFALDPAEIAAKGYASDDGGHHRRHRGGIGRDVPSGLRRSASGGSFRVVEELRRRAASSHGRRLRTSATWACSTSSTTRP